ncbi:MAG TPA: glycosyltransferase [Thermoanaerobaculia bacterium]|nr:glycosyltransferase [Thermoanaerobaculia bacterium]
MESLSAGELSRRLLAPVEPPRVGLDKIPLPPPLRPGARLAVLDVTEFFGETSGGVRTYLMEKAAYVEARPELRQVLVVPGGADAVTETEGVRCYRLRGPRVPTQHPYRFMLATRTNRRIVEHERPDVVEVGSPGLVPWIVRFAAAPLGVPLIHFFHSNYPALFGTGIAGRALARYARALDRLFAATVVTSASAADELRRAGVDRVVRIPLGVDLELFHPARRARAAEVRGRLGIAGGPLVVFVGRFAREKRLDLLLAAWPRIQSCTGAQLLLVGDGPRRESLFRSTAGQAWAASVHWLPFTADRTGLAEILAAADLFVSSGGVETFGLAALEAMAAGTPVLSADRGGVAEQVIVAGAGALFRDGDAAALAAAAQRLLATDLTPLRALARTHAAREHDWEQVFERLVALYEQVRRS